MQEPLFLFEPPAEGGFPRSWDARDKEVHDVSLAFLGQGAGRYLYIRIRKRDKEKIKKSSGKDKAASYWYYCRSFQRGGFTHDVRVPAVSDAAF
jgi:hypothetical protein